MLELLGKKIGMTHLFKDDGTIIPLTMLHVYDSCVLSLVANEDKEFDFLSVAFQKAEKPKKISKSVAGVFNKKSLPLFKKIHNSQVKKGLSLKAGDTIAMDSVIKTGDRISIRGVTSGKGFAGVMKRWNFRGLEASHGVSISHRSHGSTGQRQDPGKTFRGKKMAGHMGVENVTTKNLEVVLVDKEKSVIAVKGAVPGNAGSDVILKIAKAY
ncbi:MAG: 50S ribosomal protein L3 [Alphaproteobacteria bacterium]|nr:50S ribosomal protein L3 [Alphaproteobacteria bacterium]